MHTNEQICTRTKKNPTTAAYTYRCAKSLETVEWQPQNTTTHAGTIARPREDVRIIVLYDIPAAFGAHRISPLVCAVAIHVFDLKPPFAQNTAGVFGTMHGPSLWHTGFLYQWVYFTIVSGKIQPSNNMYRAVQLKQENSYLEVFFFRNYRIMNLEQYRKKRQGTGSFIFALCPMASTHEENKINYSHLQPANLSHAQTRCSELL